MTDTEAPLVTVAIPSYNHADYIEQCVKSVIAQSYRRIELIIIDDGSSDDTIARLEKMTTECRARFVRFEYRARENRGLCNTLNEALAWAKGKYFVIADSDDILREDHTATLVHEMENEGTLNGVFGGASVIDNTGRRVSTIQPETRYYSFTDILARNKKMVSSAGLLRTEAMRQAGGYVSGLYIEDWYIMLRLTEHGAKLKTIPTLLVLYRLHPTNISKGVQQMLDARLQILGMFSDHVGSDARRALVYVEAAIDFWRISKMMSVRHLMSALKLHPAIVAHPLFGEAVARIVTPTAITDRLKARRDRKRFVTMP